MGAGPTSEAVTQEALVFCTVYNRQSWGQKLLSRASQHVLLASQTLGDLLEAIACPSRELPQEVHDASGAIIDYKVSRDDDDMNVDSSAGAVVCVEGVVHGDAQSEDDYAEYVRSHLHNSGVLKLTSVQEGPEARAHLT